MKVGEKIDVRGRDDCPLLHTETPRTTKVPLDETRVEFDEDKIDRIVNDVRDEAHLNARRATQAKYE
jgi:hypothetical protein